MSSSKTNEKEFNDLTLSKTDPLQNDFDFDLNLDSPVTKGPKQSYDPNNIVSNKFSEN